MRHGVPDSLLSRGSFYLRLLAPVCYVEYIITLRINHEEFPSRSVETVPLLAGNIGICG